MRKTAMKTVLALLVGAVTLSSCIGSFGLTNKLLDWNKGLSNKFVNELVFILISPAYAVCGLADLLVLNTVEFWIPAVRSTQLIVQKAHPISISGVTRVTPGIAWT